VCEIIGSDDAVFSDDGETLFNHIVKVFETADKIVIDFSGVTFITLTFLNSGIGQLYGKYKDWEMLKKRLSVENISNSDKKNLQRVIDIAKDYFK